MEKTLADVSKINERLSAKHARYFQTVFQGIYGVTNENLTNVSFRVSHTARSPATFPLATNLLLTTWITLQIIFFCWICPAKLAIVLQKKSTNSGTPLDKVFQAYHDPFFRGN